MEKMDFLDVNNDCGQSLLKLAAAGSSILAELLRLSNHIPDVFLFDSRKQEDPSVMVRTADAVDKKKLAAKGSKPSHVQAQAQVLEAQLQEDTLRL